KVASTLLGVSGESWKTGRYSTRGPQLQALADGLTRSSRIGDGLTSDRWRGSIDDSLSKVRGRGGGSGGNCNNCVHRLSVGAQGDAMTAERGRMTKAEQLKRGYEEIWKAATAEKRDGIMQMLLLQALQCFVFLMS
ncbi:hypothetical protein LCGC14_3064420, partial [marine sediment metagenome]